MKYLKFILITTVVVFLAYFFLTVNRDGEKTQSPIQKQMSAQSSLETKTDEQGRVTVEVTPLLDGSQWRFNIVMDTHSVELDQDMTKVAILIDEQGREYRALNWDGPTGGHHREGILTFNKIMSDSKSIELKISETGDVVRTFVWQLNK